jgi:hypothetical protein
MRAEIAGEVLDIGNPICAAISAEGVGFSRASFDHRVKTGFQQKWNRCKPQRTGDIGARSFLPMAALTRSWLRNCKCMLLSTRSTDPTR